MNGETRSKICGLVWHFNSLRVPTDVSRLNLIAWAIGVLDL